MDQFAFHRAIDSGQLQPYACFGGQGSSNLTGLDDLIHISRAYVHLAPIQTLITSSAQRLESLAALSHRSLFFAARGFRLQTWLEDGVAPAPAPEELALSPYSFPINTLLSLVHYAITAHSLHIEPDQLRDRLHGSLGHSQGVFAAAAIATSHGGEGWQGFHKAADLAIQLSFWVGLESHFAASGSTLSADEVTDCMDCDEGAPSPLLNIVGLGVENVKHLTQTLNHEAEDGNRTYLALINGRKKCVVAGAPHSLRRVSMTLRSMRAPPSLDQSRIPFSQRRPVIDVEFLPVSAPYHSPILASVEACVMEAIKGSDLRLVGENLAIPVYCQVDGTTRNLQHYASEDILSLLLRAVTVEQVNWPALCHQLGKASHVLSFGPGPVANLIQEAMEGLGVHVLNLCGRAFGHSISSLTSSKHTFPTRQNWSHIYSPRLCNAPVDVGEPRTYIETRMTRLLGTPHVMVAGMTPTTCSPELVAAITGAGYHVEFACGGYHRAADMQSALRELAASIPAHRSITCNIIYASPKSLSWQISLLRRLIAEEGLPIDGLTVGAGIPSPEVVKEWIDLLGVSHIWFKPGSTDAIDHVLAIARNNPALPVGLQWTGGRSGGHHSCEDFHQPILERYARIRDYENIILIAGSGFGAAEDTWPYMSGSWSSRLGYAAMPFDGVLLGSRMMVAREARTSLPAKNLIVQAPGVNDNPEDHGCWTRCAQGPVGGVISVTSEMGQPIHVLATRAIRLWQEFDRRYFSIRDSGRLLDALRKDRDEIIARLNQEYFRPWFAHTDDGKPVEMEDLTYRQVLRRLCQLMYVYRQGRWIDPSYLGLVHDFLRLAHGRLGLESSFPLTTDPVELQASFNTAYGTLGEQILYPEDVARLINLFGRQGQKPVPFIPRLDANFQTWFKKDSLWQSEDVDAIVDQDAQRVCIIQGPVAARHSAVRDQPAKDILDSICNAHLEMLQNESSGDGEQPTEVSSHATNLLGIEVSHDGSLRRYHLVGPSLPSTAALVESLIGQCAWGRAALIQPKVVFGYTRVRNSIREAFEPELGDVVEVKYLRDTPVEITLYHSLQQERGPQTIRAALALSHLEHDEISVALMTRSMGKKPALEFKLKLLGGMMGHSILSINRTEYLKCVQLLYTQLWIGRHLSTPCSAGLDSETPGDQVTITAEAVNAFLSVVRQTGPIRARTWEAQGALVPLDYAVVIAWTALAKPLLINNLDADLLQLLHQSISIKLVSGVRPLHVGDTVTTSSRITERAITPTGQRVEVSADILRDSKPVVRLRTTFVIRRRTEATVPLQQFHSVDEPDMVMHVDSFVQLQVLISRKWLFLDGPSTNLLGKTLVFQLHSQTLLDASGTPASLQVSGSVLMLSSRTTIVSSPGSRIGRVYLEDEGYKLNPVMDFLNRHGARRVSREMLRRPGWANNDVTSISFVAPSQSESYAAVSGDTNPIHVCPLFARYAGLGQPVVHGMHLSATVRRLLEWLVGDTQRTRFCSWEVSFDSLVRAHDALRMETQHVAMENGRMVMHVKVLEESTGEQVMHAEAVVEQPEITYVFTGQGTQEKGMGMSLYDSHSAARAVWDRAEQHFLSQYGISLLHIVRNNPSTLSVNFRTERGRQIRANYLDMLVSDNWILPGLTENSRSHTFTYPAGLLMSTQFAQPALTVMEMAEYAHLQAHGVVQTHALFAGHSLGEYSALGACSTFMPFESLLSLIFYRGLKMQNALPRDENGRTEYAMMAVDPSRIRADFNEESLKNLVQLIGQETRVLLEVVNYNVESRQYVCAGHIRSLWLLGHTCDDLSRSPAPSDFDTMNESIKRYLPGSLSNPTNLKLTRGRATIPLTGVDIPFHSQLLRSHIDDYRQYLRSHLRASDIKVDELVGRWIPNVVGKPFSLDAEYIRLVQGITESQPLLELLRRANADS
ncbi:putative sterigmatocystin biosynthesis fatty acid synthase subunit beta [Aspergillus multicolor]|uniref:putative sterigmatocystin biosynthesis fatty acid synthase subunit beta n=1 Tax=Aspergillus multicolor TaxID=41759 RepID=UPI003CCD457C